ncbi:MAG: hypothetical protein RL385_1491 [Pseudomonadota bacterium]
MVAVLGAKAQEKWVIRRPCCLDLRSPPWGGPIRRQARRLWRSRSVAVAQRLEEGHHGVELRAGKAQVAALCVVHGGGVPAVRSRRGRALCRR